MSENYLPLNPKLEEEISIFETMRSYNGRILGLREHWTRLRESGHTLGLEYSDTFEEFEQKVTAAIALSGSKDALLRPTLFKSGFNLFARPLLVLDPALYEKGVKLATAPERLAMLSAGPVGTKSTWYGPQALSHITHLAPNFEVLFCDTNGYVGELRINNIFIIKRGVLKTPPAVHILNGVTRRFVLSLAGRIPIPVEETFLTRHDIFNADECFLTNSVVEILPVQSLDGRLVNEGKPGSLTLKLRALYQELIRKV